jgi:phosphoserine aminotransferase
MPGGGTLQFSAVIYNLVPKSASSCVYLSTGTWSRKAAEEAAKILPACNCQLKVIDLIETCPEDGNQRIKSNLAPMLATTKSDRPAYIYYCENETIDGIEFPSSNHVADCIEQAGMADVPLVADMSSNFLSRPVDVRRFGVIFATAQKNFGPAGVSVVIVRRNLLTTNRNVANQGALPIPTIMDYSIAAANGSLYNTPPSMAIYVCNEVFHWLVQQFGSLDGVAKCSDMKARILYDAIRESDGFYYSPVGEESRSRMNVVFRIRQHGKNNQQLEESYIKEAESLHMQQLRGHRSVGGIRVSLYNAVTIEEVQAVVRLMKSFAQKHAK